MMIPGEERIVAKRLKEILHKQDILENRQQLKTMMGSLLYFITYITTVMLADGQKTYTVENIKHDELIITGSGESQTLGRKQIHSTEFEYPWENKRSRHDIVQSTSQ
jgi:hypothetical protein